MNNKIDLSIIVLSYNTKQLLDNCLASIFQRPQEIKVEVIVVDNGSKDKSQEMVKNKFPQVQLLESAKNLGYSAGNNLGIKKTQGEFILLLNSDTEILGESLGLMVKSMRENKEVGILGPKLINPDQKSQKSVGSFYSLGQVILTMLGAERLGLGRSAPENYCLVDWVSGACFLVRRNVFENIGLLDEKLFMYMEEVEFCFRARQKGVLTAYLPQAQVLHRELGSSISGKTDAVLNIFKGLLYFYQKYYPNWQYGILKAILKSKAAVLLILGRIVNNRYLVSTYGQAFELVK